MFNYIFTLLLVLGLGVITLYKATKCNDTNWFMSIDYTKALKGIMCIIVILVHIPKAYSNKIQDMIGSFGYICVTIFFLFSAYGLMYSLKNKKDYLKTFWKKRILILIIPYFIVNCANTILFHENLNFYEILLKLCGLNDVNFITVLLIFYILFYIIGVSVKNNRLRDILYIVFPIVYSLINYYSGVNKWGVEALGFSYGIILFINFEKINRYIQSNIMKSLYIYTGISIILGLLYLKFKNVFFYGDYILKIFLGISLIITLFNITNRIKISNPILAFLGRISYEVYLLHRMIIAIVCKINGLSSWQFIYTVIFLTIFIAYFLNMIDNSIYTKIRREKNA